MRHLFFIALLFSSLIAGAQDGASQNCNDNRMIYKVCSDQKDIFTQAANDAQAKKQWLAVTFGAQWCPWCRSLNTLFSKIDFVQKMNGNFLTINIAVYQPESYDVVPTGMSLLNELLAKNNQDISIFNGVPLLVVVDPLAQKAVFIQTGDLEDNSNGEGHDPAKVLSALNKAAKELESK